jgi:hypothetical protein
MIFIGGMDQITAFLRIFLFSHPITREIVRPLIRHLNEITHGNFFDYLITPDGPLLAAIRKREARQSDSNGFPSAKKMKPMLPEVPMEDLETAAKAAAAAQTQEEVAAIIKNSRQVFLTLFNYL